MVKRVTRAMRLKRSESACDTPEQRDGRLSANGRIWPIVIIWLCIWFGLCHDTGFFTLEMSGRYLHGVEDGFSVRI